MALCTQMHKRNKKKSGNALHIHTLFGEEKEKQQVIFRGVAVSDIHVRSRIGR